jgi:hypothetical protein
MFTEDNRQDAECRGRISASARKASKIAPKPSVCSDGCQAVRITPLDAHAKRGPTGDRNRREAGRPNDAENGSETADMSGCSLFCSYQEVKSGNAGPQEASQILHKVLPDIEKVTRRKVGTLKLLDALRNHDPERADKLKNCGGHLAFRHWIDHGVNTLASASWCNMPRLCQACAHARGMRLARAAAEKAVTLLDDDRDLRPWLVTFTVKNGPDLAERLNHLLNSFSKGWERRKNFRSGKRPWTPVDAPEASIFSAEIKRGSGGRLWHPHLHCLWLVPKHVWKSVAFGQGRKLELESRDALRGEWHDITGDSSVVSCDYLRTGQDMDEGKPVDEQYVMTELFEVFKYMTKPGDDMKPADVVHAWQTAIGKRLVRSHGLFRGLVVPEALDDDPLDGPSWEIMMRWWDGAYRRVSQRFMEGTDHVGKSEAETVG